MLVGASHIVAATVSYRSLIPSEIPLNYCGPGGAAQRPAAKDPSGGGAEEKEREALLTEGRAHRQVLCHGRRSSDRLRVTRSSAVKENCKNQSPLSPLLKNPQESRRAGDRRISKGGVKTHQRVKSLRLSRSVPCRSVTAGLLVLLTTAGQGSGRKTNWSPVS